MNFGVNRVKTNSEARKKPCGPHNEPAELSRKILLWDFGRKVNEAKKSNFNLTPRYLTVRKKLLFLAWSVRDE